MTVSPSHSVNLAGLNAAMTGLGLIGGLAGAQQCTLYFTVPSDVYPVYQHKVGSMVPSGSALPGNVALMVLEIPLPQQVVASAAAAATGTGSAAAAAASSSASSAGGKRKLKTEDPDTLLPPTKKAADTKCDCTTGCKSGRCKCFKHGNRCGPNCHTAAAASGTACANP